MPKGWLERRMRQDDLESAWSRYDEAVLRSGCARDPDGYKRDVLAARTVVERAARSDAALVEALQEIEGALIARRATAHLTDESRQGTDREMERPPMGVDQARNSGPTQ